MNRVPSLERKTPQLRGGLRESVAFDGAPKQAVSVLSFPLQPLSNPTDSAKGQRMSRCGVVWCVRSQRITPTAYHWCRASYDNPRWINTTRLLKSLTFNVNSLNRRASTGFTLFKIKSTRG